MHNFLIRLADLILSAFGLILLSPFLLCLIVIIKLTSSGPVLYVQNRVGKHNKDFQLFKFRTMYVGSDSKGLLTIGAKDNRVTPIGQFLRKYKIDELPQLINVLKGEMSLVGPRPEVRKYVDMYTPEQMEVLSIAPGITDYASIVYKNENEILAQSSEPEQFYIQTILPEKIRLNFAYLRNRTIVQYFRIIFLTISGIFTK